MAVGIVMSVVTYYLQEGVVPYANDQLTEIENGVINHISAFNRDLTVSAPLPGGGRQVTIATAYEPNSRALLHVTLIQYDNHNEPRQIIFADRAEFAADKWTLQNSSVYRFNPDGTTLAEPHIPHQEVEIGEKPTDLVKRMSNDDPENMSRSEIADVVRSGQLTETERRKYVTTYQEKLARPFACFVFILIAIPFGLRPIRSSGSTSLGFGLSLGDRLRLLRRHDDLLVCGRGHSRVRRALGVDAESALHRDRVVPIATSRDGMSFVEIVRGIGNVAFVMVIAGGVAYVGDRVGHQVGRRRLSLFGIRPRYTSTIVAIATGMVIALVVTLGAIFASQQVKTAFFKLNSINAQINELQARQRDLETKVNTGRLVFPVDTLMVPFYRIIDQSASSAQRLSTIRDYYFFAVKYVNATYPRLGLRPYVFPPT